MLNHQQILAIIPARGGSKGILKKNTRPFCGKPLIAWTIEAAKKSKYLDRIILSSECDDIIEIAKNYNCDVPFKRPIELAKDDTPGIEPIMHALSQVPNYDYVMVLQPTSPLRTALDIDECIEHCFAQHAPACVSINRPEQTPFWMYTKQANETLSPLLPIENNFRRQTLPTVYALNGALYLAQTSWLLQNKSFISKDTIGFELPLERAIDIDEPKDFVMAEYLARGLSWN
jgi:N-acylneuraminate cytidylyltransferase